MEFPSLGEQCSYSNCQRLDFIPLRCECFKYFCKDHFLPHCLSGECSEAEKPKDKSASSTDSIIFKCHSDNCKMASLIEMACLKCEKHFCITHRFHASCYNLNCDPDASLAQFKLEEELDKKHEQTRQLIEAEVTERLRKAEQTSKAKTALKIQLMKLKSKATGEKSVSVPDRAYFAVRIPADVSPKNLQNTPRNICSRNDFNDVSIKPVFVSKQWSLGRTIDSICDTCLIKNDNNMKAAPKIRLFRESDGMCVSLKEMDQSIENLLENKTIVDGERILLEYVSADYIQNAANNTVHFIG